MLERMIQFWSIAKKPSLKISENFYDIPSVALSVFFSDLRKYFFLKAVLSVNFYRARTRFAYMVEFSSFFRKTAKIHKTESPHGSFSIIKYPVPSF